MNMLHHKVSPFTPPVSENIANLLCCSPVFLTVILYCVPLLCSSTVFSLPQTNYWVQK